MEEDNIKVTVTIGQRPLTVIIKKEWEHYFREAEKVINDSFFDFAKKWQYKDQQDLTNMVLLDFVVTQGSAALVRPVLRRGGPGLHTFQPVI